MTAVDVVGLGAATLDYLGLVPHFPDPDDKMTMLEFAREGGGLVATALVAVARLGASTRYVGKLGEDEFSRFIVDGFRREGVRTDAIVTRQQVKGRFSFIIVEEGTGLRTILHSGHGPARLAPEELDREAILSGRALLIDTSDPVSAFTAAGWARAAGRPVVLDADKYDPAAPDLAAAADFAIASQRYATARTSLAEPAAAAEALAGEVPGIVIVTAGRAGAYVAAGRERFHQPALSVPVKDTTGAGDVFHGAFLYAHLQEWDLRRCVAFAAAVAALKCRALGGRAGIPTLAEALAFLGWARG
jgi:sugar/nucleoside kinase (ribokinase family)